MIIRVEGRINVDGQWWDIQTEHSVPDNTPSKLKVEMIEQVIKGIASTGKLISRVGANEAPDSTPKVSDPGPVVNGVQAAMFAWPLPHCGIHNEAMAVSKVQNDQLKVSFYCPKRHGQDYCKSRAKVDKTNGMPVFFEVK